MEKEISKKDLLVKYNISYGTLYRWKRMGLIPDEWFVKKSTFTGQETFFNEEKICQRVEAIIKEMGKKPLEQIARELLHTDESTAKLRVETKYGVKEYNLSDIESIAVVKDGNRIDITNAVKEKLQ